MSKYMQYEKDLISVIVPVYGVEEYLCRCIDSVLKQTYKKFELILVDDGSLDCSGKICDEYAKTDERIKVIHKKNGGLSDARNAGLTKACGEYISFIDSDDWVSKEYLERLLNALKETRADICECNVLKTKGEEKTQTLEKEMLKIYDTIDALEQLICDNVLRQYVWNKIYRRCVIKNISFPKGKTNEDEFWTYQVFGNAQRVTKIPDILYYYFQRPNSIMGKDYSLKRLDAIAAKLERQSYIKKHFPELEEVARLNLFGSCIYAGQMSIRYLSEEQLVTVKGLIKEVLKDNKPSCLECLSAGGGNKVWFLLARNFFWRTCQLKNFLKKGL